MPLSDHPSVQASKYCTSGTGNDCGDLAGGNELILKLQQQSAANKDMNEKNARDAYYIKNFPDFFAAVGKKMVKKQSDGAFMVVSDSEFEQLRAQNKLEWEIPKSMGVNDMTQKPIWVLKD